MATDTDTVTNTDTITITITNPPSHHSPSNSQGSSTNPPPPPPLSPPTSLKEEIPETPGDKQEEEEDTAMDTGASAHLHLDLDKKPQIHDGFQDFTAEEILKYQRYEADYACRLKAKYFSNKDIYGGEIFDLAINIGDEPIKASRWSPTRSYADPKQSFVDQGDVSASAAETCPSIPNGNITPQKKS